MTAHRILRQATTPIGFDKRLRDMNFEMVTDPRYAPNVIYPLPCLLQLIVLSIASGAGAAHGVERRTAQLKDQFRNRFALPGTVADNTISNLLPRLDSYELNNSNAALIKAEKRRGNLAPSGGLNFHVVAIDGKCLIRYRWSELVRLTRMFWRLLYQAHPQLIIPPAFDLEQRQPNVWEVYCLFSCYFHNIQIINPKDGLPWGKLMVHRATLVSAEASVGLIQRAIPACTNESGMVLDTLLSVLVAFGRTDLCAMFVMDAGNTCLKAADWLRAHGRDYFMTLKSNHGHLFKQAVALLGDAEQDVRPEDLRVWEHRGGKDVLYRIWQEPLEQGFDSWGHARQLVRVERLVIGDEPADVSVGNRYYVSSKSLKQLSASVALRLSRVYWRCENEGHWTADVILEEDRLKGRLSRHPNGVLVAGWLRMVAQNVLAVLRSLSRSATKEIKPSWKEVLEYVFVSFFEHALDTTRFDAVEV